MSHQDFSLDMTMMFAVHDALRRDVERIARITATKDYERQLASCW